MSTLVLLPSIQSSGLTALNCLPSSRPSTIISSFSPTRSLCSSSTGLFSWPQIALTLSFLHTFAHTILSAWKHTHRPPPPPPPVKVVAFKLPLGCSYCRKALTSSLSWLEVMPPWAPSSSTLASKCPKTDVMGLSSA